MNSGWKKAAMMMAVLPAVVGFSAVVAKNDAGTAGPIQRFVIEFQDPPLAGFTGGRPPTAILLAEPERFEATSPLVTGQRKLNVRSPQSRSYLSYLDRTHEAFKLEAAVKLGRSVRPPADACLRPDRPGRQRGFRAGA